MTESTEQKARAAGREVGRWVERLARVGFLAKALVYGLVGVLALRLATGAGGETTGEHGALLEIAAAPWGRALLVVVGLGLLGYAAWRIVHGLLDADRDGTDPGALALRAGRAGSGVLHALLAFSAFSLAAGGGGGGGGEEEWTARLLSQEGGAWLVGLAGLVVLVVAAYQFRLGYQARFTRHWDTGAMSPKARGWATHLGRAGHMARGVVFAVIGVFLLRAAGQHDSDEARGLGGALAEVASAPYGAALLALVAAGLICYALYCVVEARYRRLRVG